MAFLYSTYIVIYAITSPLLGRYIDRISARNNGDIHEAIQNVAGVQFTIIAALMIAATFVPKGAVAFNPKNLYGEDLTHDVGQTYEKDRESSDGELKDEKAVMQTAVKSGGGPL